MTTPDLPEGIGEAISDAAAVVGDTAEDAARHPIIRNGARLGYGVSGALHLVMGALAVRLATGDASATPDQSGAFASLASSPIGWLLLGMSLIGLALLGLWQVVQVARRRPVGSRGKAAAKAILYLGMAAGVVGFLRGTPTSSVAQTRDATAWLMSLPFGGGVVAATGLAVVGVGVFHVVKGLRRGFRKDLAERPPRWVEVSASVGYVAKGIALLVAGYLFVVAAWTRDPGKSSGLDGALWTLLLAPAGPAIVAAIGIGFAAYGVYSLARARFARTFR